jgi:hypothetical protein
MNYILKVNTRYKNSEGNTLRKWAFKTYYEACKQMIEQLEKLNRQIQATDLTNVTGYTIEIIEWVTGNEYKTVEQISYDLAL